MNNSIKKSCSFIIFFNLNLRYSFLKRFFIKSFYKFSNYSRLFEYNEEKKKIKSSLLIFNYEKGLVEVLVQLRPPICILIILSYSLVYFLYLVF